MAALDLTSLEAKIQAALQQGKSSAKKSGIAPVRLPCGGPKQLRGLQVRNNITPPSPRALPPNAALEHFFACSCLCGCNQRQQRLCHLSGEL